MVLSLAVEVTQRIPQPRTNTAKPRFRGELRVLQRLTRRERLSLSIIGGAICTIRDSLLMYRCPTRQLARKRSREYDGSGPGSRLRINDAT